MQLTKAIILLFLIGSTSCISELELDTIPNIENLIAIQARLVKGTPNVFFATVEKVRDFGGSPTGPIRLQRMTLSNELGQEIAVPRAAVDEYELEIAVDSEDFIIEDFMSFNLEIEVSDGRIFTSTFEQLLPVSKIDQLDFEFFPVSRASDKIQFSLSTSPTLPDSDESARYRWTFEEVYQQTEVDFGTFTPKTCYVTGNLGALMEITIDTAIDDNEDNVEDFQFFEQNVSSVYSEGNYFILLQHSLTKSAFIYFDQISDIIDREGSIFDVPPGRVPTNFTNSVNPEDEIFGYFYVTTIDTSRLFISPEMVGSPRLFCPPPRPFTPCIDCLDQMRSTIERPSWWQ